MATEGQFEKSKLKELIPSLEQVEEEKGERWFPTAVGQSEPKGAVQTVDIREFPRGGLPKVPELELSEPEEELEAIFPWQRRRAKPETRKLEERITQLSRQTENLQRYVIELQSRANFYFSEQTKHLQALAHQITRQEIQQRSLTQQVAEFVEKAASLSPGSRKRDIRSFINTGIIGFGAMLGSAIYVTLAGFWSANVGAPIIVAFTVLFIALALERFNLKNRRNE